MKQRCYNPKNDRYSTYGARGINVCEAWMEFEVFEDWAMSNGYANHLTIDRIASYGNYTPANCQWLTKGENSRKVRIEIGENNRALRAEAKILKTKRSKEWDNMRIELYGPMIKEMLLNGYKNWEVQKELNLEKNIYYHIKKNIDI